MNFVLPLDGVSQEQNETFVVRLVFNTSLHLTLPTDTVHAELAVTIVDTESMCVKLAVRLNLCTGHTHCMGKLLI